MVGTVSPHVLSVCLSLSHQSKEVGLQLQEDLLKVLNELYSVRKTLFITVTSKIIILSHDRLHFIQNNEKEPCPCCAMGRC